MSVAHTQATAHIVECRECDDDGACKAHKAHQVWCRRCARTGRFITGVENGQPKGPGGPCFRCGGKGFHTARDRARNAAYARLGRR